MKFSCLTVCACSCIKPKFIKKITCIIFYQTQKFKCVVNKLYWCGEMYNNDVIHGIGEYQVLQIY